MLAFISVLACVLVASCSANTYRMGACPRVTVMRTVDFDQLLGDWYVVQRFNPMATCTKISIEKGDDDQYTFNETARPLGINFSFHNQFLNSRKVNFLRNDTNSIFRLQKNFAYYSLSTFGIVDTDYQNYAVIWGCDPVLFGSVQNVDVLSREQKVSDETLKKARDVIKEMNVDVHPLDNVGQASCGSSEDSNRPSGNGDPNTNNIVVDGP